MGRDETRSRLLWRLRSFVRILLVSGWHLQDTRLLPMIRATRVLGGRCSLTPRPFIPPFSPRVPSSRLSCGRELLLSNDTARRQRISDLFIRPSDYNVSVIPRDNLSRQGGEAVPREFIDGCSCVPYGVVAVHRQVSTGHVLNRLLVTIKARVRSKTLPALLRKYKNYCTLKLLFTFIHNTLHNFNFFILQRRTRLTRASTKILKFA